MSRWAESLSVHPTMMSQVLQGKKELSLEAADQLSGILNLTDSETDYFILLVQYERAGSDSLRKRLRRQIKAEQERSNHVGSRLKVSQVLDATAQSVFYSSWLYSGVRNIAALKEMNSAEEIAERLSLPREIIQLTMEFLLKHDLCTLDKGSLKVGPKRTHIDAGSPHVARHHQNWRNRAAEKTILRREKDLFFTFPMSLSEDDASEVRQLIPSWIEMIHSVVEPSASEAVRCLNIDFFEY